MADEPLYRHRVALQGFSAFERSALASYFRLAAGRSRGYEQVDDMAAAQFVIADADHPGVIEAIIVAEREHDTVFIGAQAPERALAWMMRPIDPLHVLRELDASIALREPQVASAAMQPPHATRTVDAPPVAPGTPARRASDGPVITARPLRPRQADVLVVDDSSIALRFIERQLEALGVRTERANTSGRALEWLEKRSFGFVFVDVELGEASELDGLALCQLIKQQHRQPDGQPPVVVMLSSHADAVDRVRGTLAGCDAYLAKPLAAEELRRTLERHGAKLLRRGSDAAVPTTQRAG